MLIRWNVALKFLTFLLEYCFCANYSTPSLPSKFSPPSPPSPIFPLVNGPPIRMQFTIEWTNLTQFFLGQHQQLPNSSAWIWHKTRAEGWTGSGEDRSVDGDVNLEEIFPDSSNKRRQANQSQTTIKPTTFPAKNTNKSFINTVMTVNIVPQKNSTISQPNKIGQKIVVPLMGTTKMTTTFRTTTTTTAAKIISTNTPSTTTKESAQPKTTPSGGKKILQMFNTSTSNLAIPIPTKISTSTTPISISTTTTTIPLPFRLRFLLTRRIRPLMIMRKMAPSPSSTTIQSAMFSSTTPKMLIRPYSTLSQINPPPKPPAGRIILHDIGKMPAKPSPIPSADAPGLSPKPPGTHQPMPIAVESRKYLPIPNFGANRPNNNNNRGGGCGERREIDGDTKHMLANKEEILMKKYGTNCGSTLQLNQQQQQMPQRMPLPPPPSPMNGILTPQQEMTFKLAMDPVDEGGNGCSCHPQSLAQSFGFRPIPNKCCRRPKCFDCPTIVDHNSTLPSPIPIDSTIQPITTMAPIVLPMPAVWENPNKNNEKHKALGLS